jgi:hypothetical protein
LLENPLIEFGRRLATQWTEASMRRHAIRQRAFEDSSPQLAD